MKNKNDYGLGGANRKKITTTLVVAMCTTLYASITPAAPVPGGTLDPTTVPKYVTPLVIPPVMNNTGVANDYDIAVRQFSQQILPGGLWNTINGRADAYPPTKVWSYGPVSDPLPDSTVLGGGVGVAPAANSQFNYPAYTVENRSNVTTTVDWFNDLVVDPLTCKASASPATDPACNFLPHLLTVDRALHWANPEQLPCTNPAKTKDCRPALSNGAILATPYNGPVPIITHVHGAHVGSESDGYPEAWWLPNANNIPVGYSMIGSLVNKYGTVTNNPARPGVASFTYPNTQPSTTLWYHDHTLGMTRSNVYAGPAGFWLIRDGNALGGESGLLTGVLPGPAPKAGETLAETNLTGRGKYREIPIVIQDRSFNIDGSLFYPANRAFFEGLGTGQTAGTKANQKAGLNINTIGSVDPLTGTPLPSDIATAWNPEAFFNVMVVNGVSWPKLDVAQAQYRFRLLNGCNSRFLNLSMFVVDPVTNLVTAQEVPIYQIGAEQSLMPKVVKVQTGFRTVLPGNGNAGVAQAATDPQTALLMGLAERADVIVDFSGLAPGTHVRMINTAPDWPFGGFPDIPADTGTSGQVMEFVVNVGLNGLSPTDPTGATPATAPQNLVLSLPDSTDPANGPLKANPRDLALMEEESNVICARVSPAGKVSQDDASVPDPLNPGTCVKMTNGKLAASLPFAPKAAVLGQNGGAGGAVTLWSDPIVTNPTVNATETWELWNWTVDAHPIHMHLVKFMVKEREGFDPVTGALSGVIGAPEATETGWKDTVIAYPSFVTRLNATFDLAGLYVWHCHIVEHEDNEMMVPFCVGDKATSPGCNAVP